MSSLPASTPTSFSEATWPEYSPRRRAVRLRYWHEAIIDDMLLHPLDTYEQRSKRLGYAKNYLQLLCSSDMFRAAYTARRSDMTAQINASVSMKMGQVANTGLDIMLETLEQKRVSLPFDKVAEATADILEKLGFSAAKPTSPSVQVNVGQNAGANVVQVSPEALAAARERLRDVEAQRAALPPAVEGPFQVLSADVPAAEPEILLPGDMPEVR